MAEPNYQTIDWVIAGASSVMLFLFSLMFFYTVFKALERRAEMQR